MKRSFVIAAVSMIFGSLLFSVDSRVVSGHCQVPCGIYDDAARITAMKEDATTIGKAVTEITALAGKGTALDINQTVRWVNTKEEHASKIIETVSLYFLTQKVKDVPSGDAGYQDYLASLADHHAVLRAAMTAKQTVDMGAVDKLNAAIVKLAKRYP